MSSRRRVSAALLGLLALVVAVYIGREVGSDDDNSGDSTPNRSVSQQLQPAQAQQSGELVALSALPDEATVVWRLIEAGGPFPYEQDGRTFGNRERLLPAESSGYYREYTIPTPGEDDRGPRRFVLGREDELYYTADHYESFVRVDPDR